MRKPVSAQQNIWFDGRSVDDSDLTLEQDYNNKIQSGIINNHFGTGVLSEFLTQKVIFNSIYAIESIGLLDGKAIDVQDQPSDKKFGNILEVELKKSLSSGNRTVKLAVIGLDFDNNLQYETFTFRSNETKFSKKHYTRILKILLNDFIGSPSNSLNLGGELYIREAKSFNLSRDCLSASQDIEPNLFFRDFYVASGTLQSTLQNALPSYNIDNIKISTGYKQLREISSSDVSTQIGQKFLIKTNNIQKITLLLSVDNLVDPSDLIWSGELLINVYKLQSTLNCPIDISPSLAIEFEPSNIPIAQLGINYNTLKNNGIELNTVPQPVDFVFSNSLIGSGSIVSPENYYVVTLKRAGTSPSIDNCVIQLATGNNYLETQRLTIFNGNVWLDVPEESLWFQVWSDSAKLSDGQAYDNGIGIIIPKTKENSSTGISEDFSIDKISFPKSNTNNPFYAIVSAGIEKSNLIQDERTGNNVLSRKQAFPEIKLFNSDQLMEIEDLSDPLVVGNISDKNVKSTDSNPILGKFYSFGFINNEIIIKMVDDVSDPRFDYNNLNLITYLSDGSLNNAKIIPDTSNPNFYYRISKAELISMTYGDINGDGIVDELDLLESQNLVGIDINNSPATNDEYTALTKYFKDDTGLSFQLTDPSILESGLDGVLTSNPFDGSKAGFYSPSVNFSAYTNLSSLKLVIYGSLNTENNGTFEITGIVNSNTINIKKVYYNSDILLKVLRADITGNLSIGNDDINYIENYVKKISPYPATSIPANKVGTKINALKITVEKFVDRNDDYHTSSSRSSEIHPIQNIFTDNSNLLNKNLLTNPIIFNIYKQLTWNDELVISTSNPKLVPASFNFQRGFRLNSCLLDGYTKEMYPSKLEFDPGRNDIFIPNDLVLNFGGELKRPDGYYYKVDMEVASIILEVPTVNFSSEKTINIFTDFVSNFSENGFTRIGYEAMRFADCSYVEKDALQKNQVRFSVSVQAFSPKLDGENLLGDTGIIVDGKIGVKIDYTTGLLYLNFTNLYEDPVYQTLKTKVQIFVYLKKSGFNNKNLTISSEKIKNILAL